MPANLNKNVLTQKKKRRKNKKNGDEQLPPGVLINASLKKKNKGHRSKSPSPAPLEERNESPNNYPPRDDINNYVPNELSNDGFDVDYSPDARESSRSPYASDGQGPFDEEGEAPDGAPPAEEQEDARDYVYGGYYPVRLGEVFNGRYHVIRKLGWGHFSTVWLCWDVISRRFVAMKIVKSAENYSVSAADEIQILKECMKETNHSGKSRVIEFLDDFKVRGVNGEHVLGCTLLKLIMNTNYTGLPLNQVRIITKQILQGNFVNLMKLLYEDIPGLSYLHESCFIIHTDLKPENVLVEMTPLEIRDMAQDMIIRINSGQRPDTTEVCNMPPEMTKMSKNKKKKLRKRKKKQRELLEKQLYEVEGLNVSINANLSQSTDQPIASKIPDSILNEKIAPIPRCSVKLPVNDTNNTNNTNNSNGVDKEHEPAEEPQNDENGTKKKKKKKNKRKRKNETNQAGDAVQAEGAEENNSTAKPKENAEGAKNETDDDSDDESPLQNGKFTNTLSELLMNLPNSNTSQHGTDDIRVKIADLGNACWRDHHFTTDIQTRQYRALEVIIGAGYDTSADIWSVACIAFELATGDYLFEPHGGPDYGRDEDHLAHVIETDGYYGSQILRPWSLPEVLMQKYQWQEHHARGFSEFLLELLRFDPIRRMTATEALRHEWLNTPITEDPANFYMNGEEMRSQYKRGTSV
ncbi:BMA-SPK-1, isoform e [Aphelenchoides bicaudatus]|nr:BMA-SPK-1, isoform e [Aphelenchoides bicaudatus]